MPTPPTVPIGNQASALSTPVLVFYVDGSPVDLGASKVCDIKLAIGYSHPARLEWTVYAPQHTTPFFWGDFVQFTDETFGGLATPLFEGHVHEIRPVSSNELRYVAYDPTRRAAHEVFITNGFFDDASSSARAVWNCKIDNDDDYAFEIEHDASTAVIISQILENAIPGLLPLNATPAVGQAYVDSDLTPFDYIPQEKVVFESETIRGGLDRLLGIYPQYRIFWHPGEGDYGRKWRFLDVKSSPQVTLTLNDYTPENPHHVLSLDINPSMENRYTAVKIEGPETTATADVNTSSGLTKLWNGAYESGFEVAGPGGSPLYADVSKRWQVTDTTKRNIANLLPEPYSISGFKSGIDSENANVATPLSTRQIVFLATWDGGTTWESILNFDTDKNQGIVTTPYHVYKYEESEIEGEGPSYTLPDQVRLVYPYYTTGLTVRYPTSSYSGTAYSVNGAAIEMRRYDESLAVGFERWVIATQAEREAEFAKLAQSVQEAHRDIIYTGGCSLRGLQYEFLRLNKRLNFAAIDGDGDPLTTGWEDINAIVTDVEYDFENRLTTIQISSDHLEYGQGDPEQLKTLLKLDALREPEPNYVVIEYDFGYGRKARFVVSSVNEDRYSGDAAAAETASRYDPNSPNYQG